MENKNNKLPAIGKALLKFLGSLLLIVLFFFGVVLIAIRIPAVQTRAVQEASKILSEKLRHQVSVERVDISFFNKVILDKVKVLDYKKEVLFYVDRLAADISLFSIFHPNQLSISQLTLTAPRANLVKYQGSDTLNMTSFIRAINRLLVKKDSTTAKKPFQFEIDALTLHNGHFSYDDQNKPPGTHPGSLDYQHLEVDSIFVTVSEITLGDTLSVHVRGLRAKEVKSGTRLRELSTHMTYAPTLLGVCRSPPAAGQKLPGPVCAL